MLEFVLDVVLAVVVIRAIWALLKGIKVGMSVSTADPGQTRQRGAPPAHGVHMIKDPVCGTYVVPNPALSTTVGRQTMYFCSAACRDKYRARTA